MIEHAPDRRSFLSAGTGLAGLALAAMLHRDGVTRADEGGAPPDGQPHFPPKVKRVIYPGLASHPDHALAARQMKLPGAMISAELHGGLDESAGFLKRLGIFACAESLGGVESLAEHPAIMTHASVPEASRRVLGISDSLVRLSVGLEDVGDLWADIEHALS